MTDMASRTISVHKKHELMLKFETAGLNDKLAKRVIDSMGNDLASKVVRLIENGEYKATTSQHTTWSILRSSKED